MNIYGRRLERLADSLVSAASLRKPDFVVGAPSDPYLRRWYLVPRNRWGNAYLHQFVRSDEDRAHHDHMYANVSVILRGEYVEERIERGGVRRRRRYGEGDALFRLPSTAHRIIMPDDRRERTTWTLFLAGPRVREWGFHCPDGWRHWTAFVGANPGEVGPGCD